MAGLGAACFRRFIKFVEGCGGWVFSLKGKGMGGDGSSV